MRAGIGSQPWIGLDVGTFGVKLVAIQSGVGGTRYWSAEANYSPPDDGERRITSEMVARAVADCMTEVELNPRAVAGVSLGISGPDVIVKQITLPMIDDAELDNALRYEARKHVPFDPATMLLDYQVLGKSNEQHQTELLLAAVSREHLERDLAPLKKLGLDPHIVDATPLALINAVVHNDLGTNDARVLLDVGAAASHLVIYKRDQPFFARRFEFGGQTLTRAIAAAAQVSFVEAERRKLELGKKEGGAGAEWESAEWRALSESLRRDLAEEVVRSIAFYRTQAHFPEVPRIWLSGGTAKFAGIGRRLGDTLGVPVEVLNPFGSMGSTKAGATPPSGPQYTQAFGLALRAA